MTDFDSIWRTQDEIRTVVNAVLGECIWDLSYNERRMGIELELTQYLEEESADALINQFAHLKPPCEVLRPLIDHVEAHAVAVTVQDFSRQPFVCVVNRPAPHPYGSSDGWRRCPSRPF